MMISISPGNDGIGRIPNVSLVSGRSCPGKSKACAGILPASHDSIPKGYWQCLKASGQDCETCGMCFRSKKQSVYFPIHGQAKCYGDGLENTYPSAKQAWSGNLETAKNEPDTFFANLREYLTKKQPRRFRIHVSGDFFSSEYIWRWIGIIAEFTGTVFVAFTRSWRNASLIDDLDVMRGLPNMRLRASHDYSTGPIPQGWTGAYMYFGHRISKA